MNDEGTPPRDPKSDNDPNGDRTEQYEDDRDRPNGMSEHDAAPSSDDERDLAAREREVRERELREREQELAERERDIRARESGNRPRTDDHRDTDGAAGQDLAARERNLRERERALEIRSQERELADRERALERQQREIDDQRRSVTQPTVPPVAEATAVAEKPDERRGTPVLDVFITATLMLLVGGVLGFFLAPVVLGEDDQETLRFSAPPPVDPSTLVTAPAASAEAQPDDAEAQPDDAQVQSGDAETQPDDAETGPPDDAEAQPDTESTDSDAVADAPGPPATRYSDPSRSFTVELPDDLVAQSGRGASRAGFLQATAEPDTTIADYLLLNRFVRVELRDQVDTVASSIEDTTAPDSFLASRCESSTTEPYEAGAWSGTAARFSGCPGLGSFIDAFFDAPGDRTFRVGASIGSDADEEQFRAILASVVFEADEAAPIPDNRRCFAIPASEEPGFPLRIRYVNNSGVDVSPFFVFDGNEEPVELADGQTVTRPGRFQDLDGRDGTILRLRVEGNVVEVPFGPEPTKCVVVDPPG